MPALKPDMAARCNGNRPSSLVILMAEGKALMSAAVIWGASGRCAAEDTDSWRGRQPSSHCESRRKQNHTSYEQNAKTSASYH
mmetsp:Transcript_8032/g.18156  ORF Transcript_8032/g.18156 Transcript_8032/m.18156 type:complete len:83 (-) Transcript_8032:15-263(-)